MCQKSRQCQPLKPPSERIKGAEAHCLCEICGESSTGGKFGLQNRVAAVAAALTLAAGEMMQLMLLLQLRMGGFFSHLQRLTVVKVRGYPDWICHRQDLPSANPYGCSYGLF